MKDYKDYMDNLSVDETLHEKIMYRLTKVLLANILEQTI